MDDVITDIEKFYEEEERLEREMVEELIREDPPELRKFKGQVWINMAEYAKARVAYWFRKLDEEEAKKQALAHLKKEPTKQDL